jgi:hypothetical protein
MRIHDASNVTFQREEVSHLTCQSERDKLSDSSVRDGIS